MLLIFLSTFIRFLIYPVFVLGGGAVLLAGAAQGLSPGILSIPLLLVALGGALLLERRMPFHWDWLRPRGDTGADLLHGAAGLLLSWGSMALYAFAGPRIVVSPEFWPRHWPLAVQALLAGLIVDLGLYVMHRMSHSITWLWRFHAVHHGAERLYALNGERRHPVHFLLEGAPGLIAAGLLGVPSEAMACFLAVFHIHLLLQHGNIAYRAGLLRFVFAVAENHRWHHRKAHKDSQVNFGGLFAIWDHLFGTAFHHEEPVCADGVGIQEEPNFPKSYLGQLAYPFEA